MLGWDWYGFHKKRVGTHYGEHVFLHPVRCVSQIVRPGASGVQNVDTPFFMLGWDRCWYFLAIGQSASVQMPIVAFTKEYSKILYLYGSSNSIIFIE
jgi:hypothetical protein